MAAIQDVKRKEYLINGIEEGKRTKSPLELIVEVSESRKEKTSKELSRLGKITKIFHQIPYVCLKCDSRDAERLLHSHNGKVADVVFERNFRYALDSIRSIYLSSRFSIPKKEDERVKHHYFKEKEHLWNLENIGAYAAQQAAKGQGISVAVIDTGIDYTHSDLKDCFGKVKGINFVDFTYDPMDDAGHGTHCAGIVAGRITGVAPLAQLYAVKALDAMGSGSDIAIMAGIEWVVENKIDVISMSLGGPDSSSAFQDMINYAASKGVIIAAAAGNDGIVSPDYPAAYDNVISVAAVDRYNEHAQFSNIFGTNDISAPGVEVTSTYLGGGYADKSGTSMSTPHVAGAIALALSRNNNKDNIEYVMESCAEKLNSTLPYENDMVFGAGLLRVDRMVDAEKNDLVTRLILKSMKYRR